MYYVNLKTAGIITKKDKAKTKCSVFYLKTINSHQSK